MVTRSLPALAADGKLDAVKVLVESGNDIDERNAAGCTALHLAVAERHGEVAIYLLQHGADTALRDSDGFSTLHWAVFSDDLGILALVRDTEVDAVDNDGRTPLSWAASEDFTTSVKWLLSRGADPDRGDKDGWTPLHHAAANGCRSSLIELVKAGALIEARTALGETAKDVAVRLKYPQLLTVLVNE